MRRRGLVVDCYTYGSPRVGNEAFVGLLARGRGRCWRVTHLDDPVPRLPPMSVGYRHVSPEYWLARGAPAQDAYGPRDVRVCYGSANAQCNANIDTFSFDSHLHYFRTIAACAQSAFRWRRDAGPSAEELGQRLVEWNRMDREQLFSLLP
ncbi:hypothetical protein CDD83_574 [Cordyceps sp. RAO-2017]|nr:hypothetical protein CDD83_574 [Cordyceps sp. RAO-2017]